MNCCNVATLDADDADGPPQTRQGVMRGATISKRFIEPEHVRDVLSVSDDVPRPPPPSEGQLLVRVLACALAPGDVRVLRGDTFMQRPRSMPYVPGGDVCGEVVEVDPADPSRFAVGERVIAMFVPDTSQDGLAEFALVRTAHCAHAPPRLSDAEAAALPSSALVGMVLSKYVKKGDRVLVLGGAGGVGAHLVQFVRAAQPAYVAATTSRAQALLRELGVDRVIDYSRERWWELPELVENPVDVIFDLASGPDGWPRACASRAVKPAKAGGRYIPTMPGTARPIVKSVLGVPKLLGAIAALQVHAWLNRASVPRHMFPTPLVPAHRSESPGAPTPDETVIEELARRIAAGEARPIVDPAGPFPLTVDGIARAFELQASRHAHGKVVVTVAAL